MTAETTTTQVSNNEQKPAPKIEYKCHCNCEYCSGKKSNSSTLTPADIALIDSMITNKIQMFIKPS